MQEIIVPSTRALGTHAFYPPLAIAPSLVDDEDDEGFNEDDDEAEDMSTAIAINSLQGSINRLFDIVIKSIATLAEDLPTTRRARAIKLVQDVDDGLSTVETEELIRQFSENESSPDTYLALSSNQALRQAWIRTKLEPVFGGAVM